MNKNNEAQLLRFSVNVIDLLNQRAVGAYYGGQNSMDYDNPPLQPSGANFGLGV